LGGLRTLRAALPFAALLLSTAPVAAEPSERWGAEIAEASARFGIPEEWISRVIKAESGGQLTRGGRPIVSSAGAMGLMQLMPGTWRDVRVRLGLGRDPFDPGDNILAGTFYLRAMYDRFGYPGLFAAYNAGPSRYTAFLSGSRPLPAETAAYVAAIMRDGRRDLLPAPRSMPAVFAVRASDGARPAAGEADPAHAMGGLFVRLDESGGH
jgi:soluble lytic murein transglycosylase-like protein